MIFSQRLSNGIRVVSETMEHFRSVSIGVWVNAGSVRENEAEKGISHFIEHMLFKGTAKRTAQQIASEMDSIGGNLNAFTSKECTCFYAKVLDRDLAKAIDMLSDITLNSVIDDYDINREKGVVTEEILMTADSPEDVVFENLTSLMYEGTPLESPILGNKETVNSFDSRALRHYMDKYYTSDNTVIACAGHFEQDRLIDMLEQSFASARRGKLYEPVTADITSRKKTVSAVKDVEQTHICFGLRGFAADDDRRFALAVLSNAFGGSMSSRLFQKVREELGLAYSIYSYPSSFSGSGYFSLYAGTAGNTASRVAQVMLDELKSVRENGITADEFALSKGQLIGSYSLGQESTGARSNAIGKGELLSGRVLSENELLQKLENVTMDDIMDIIPEVTDENEICISIVGGDADVNRDIENMIV